MWLNAAFKTEVNHRQCLFEASHRRSLGRILKLGVRKSLFRPGLLIWPRCFGKLRFGYRRGARSMSHWCLSTRR